MNLNERCSEVVCRRDYCGMSCFPTGGRSPAPPLNFVRLPARSIKQFEFLVGMSKVPLPLVLASRECVADERRAHLGSPVSGRKNRVTVKEALGLTADRRLSVLPRG